MVAEAERFKTMAKGCAIATAQLAVPVRDDRTASLTGWVTKVMLGRPSPRAAPGGPGRSGGGAGVPGDVPDASRAGERSRW